MSIARTRCGRTVAATRSATVIVATLLAFSGCLDRELRPLVPCVSQGFVQSIDQMTVAKVDLLFMVDNSGSMAEEQASLARELPELVRVLTSGDRLPLGPSVGDFNAVKDLHVGVITSDMGVGGFNVTTCTRAPMFGDDGLLRTAGNTTVDGCLATYPKFLGYEPETATQTPEQFGADFGCIARAGSAGCGFEQQLEATLKAVTPSTSTIPFFGNTRGHGDAENAGFLRIDSVVALVLVTDEEDCSIATGSEEIFNDRSSTYTGDLNLRCFAYKDAQWPVQRYIDGFKDLRPGRPELVVFGAITGVPTELIPATGAPDYAAILSDPRMTEMLAPAMPMVAARLETSCRRIVAGNPMPQTAFPPRRIVQVAQGFGENGIIQSICQDSFAGALDAIIAKIADALGEVCLPRKLNPDATGLVRCDVLEVIPPPGTFDEQPTSCAELAGVNPMAKRTNLDGSIECEVTQLSTAGVLPPEVPAGEGWYYEDLTSVTARVACAGAQRIAFTAGAVPPSGIRVNLECLQRVQGSGGESGGTTIQVGTPCMPGNSSADPPAVDVCPSSAGMSLVCEPRARTCQISCATDADCPSSLVCDATSEVGICRNPICVD